jgi:hypothetical protein
MDTTNTTESIEAPQQEQPSVITLTKENSINIFIQYIEIAQKVGAYELKEADILKRASDVLIHHAKDPEISENLAINLLIQGINKAQKHGGAYTLNDAALLHKVIQYIVTAQSTPAPQNEVVTEVPQSEETSEITSDVLDSTDNAEDSDDDLASLSEPVPLRPKEI